MLCNTDHVVEIVINGALLVEIVKLDRIYVIYEQSIWLLLELIEQLLDLSPTLTDTVT